jgi:hypothetical protein
MDHFIDGPAALGGILISLALCTWTLGRWPGGLTVSDKRKPAVIPAAVEAGQAPVRAAGAAAFQDAARKERRTALAAADSLGELHAEISAYRRAQRVLDGPDGEVLRLIPHSEDLRSQCRHLGVMGEPTCGLSGLARAACACGTRCDAADPLPPAIARAERLSQPSPEAGFTRV